MQILFLFHSRLTHATQQLLSVILSITKRNLTSFDRSLATIKQTVNFQIKSNRIQKAIYIIDLFPHNLAVTPNYCAAKLLMWSSNLSKASRSSWENPAVKVQVHTSIKNSYYYIIRVMLEISVENTNLNLIKKISSINLVSGWRLGLACLFAYRRSTFHHVQNYDG